MPASIKWDLIRLVDFKNTIRGFELRRGLLVRDIPLVMGIGTGTDPEVLLKAIGVAGFPQLYDPFSPTRAWLYVQEQNVREIVRKDAVKFEIVYRGVDPAGQSSARWTIRDGYTVSYVPTYTTCFGSFPLTTWYKKGAAGTTPVSGGTAPPAGAQIKAGKTHIPRVHRTVSATQVMQKAAWDAIKAQMRNFAGTINHDSWNGTRGQWYFVGPESITQDMGTTVTVKGTWLYDPNGWFTELAWFTQLGEHPSDSISEGSLLAAGLPVEDDVLRGNGLTRCSVIGETNFNTLFSAIVL